MRNQGEFAPRKRAETAARRSAQRGGDAGVQLWPGGQTAVIASSTWRGGTEPETPRGGAISFGGRGAMVDGAAGGGGINPGEIGVFGVVCAWAASADAQTKIMTRTNRMMNSPEPTYYSGPATVAASRAAQCDANATARNSPFRELVRLTAH